MSTTQAAQRPDGPPSVRVAPSPPGTSELDPVALWASAQVTALDVEAPEYGSPAWRALHTGDPRRAVAVLAAAEQWRRHVAREAWLARLLDDDPEEWFRTVTADANDYARSIARDLARRSTHAELAARRAASTARARPVRAAPGWPPVAIPGRPGWWCHYGPGGEQLDLPHNNRPQESPRAPRPLRRRTTA